MLDFLRSDLVELTAYTPQPSGKVVSPVDRLDANESPFDLPPELKEKLAWTVQQQMLTNRYPDGSHADLKQAIAQYVNESASSGTAVTPAHISVGNGSDELIRSLLIATCVGSDGSIMVAEPTFSMYGILARTLAVPVVAIGRSPDNFALDLGEAKLILEQNPLIKAVFVVHPNSPTSNVLTEAELDWLRSLPERMLVVIDEAYFEFSQTSVVGELAKHPNWVILRTFSKAFRLAALRVGYAITHPQLIEVLEKVRLPYNLPAPSLAAAQLVLEHREQLLDGIPKILEERDRLFQTLSQYSTLQVWPGQGNFLYARFNSSESQADRLQHIFQQLKAQGTLVRYTGGGLRITVGTPEENARLRDRLSASIEE